MTGPMKKKHKWLVSLGTLAMVGAMAAIFSGSLVSAQDAPESLLPPGFDDPAPAPTPTPTLATQPTSAPIVAPQPGTGNDPGQSGSAGSPSGGGGSTAASLPSGPLPGITQSQLNRVPSLRELENLSLDELDDLLGLTPKFDVPATARRTLSQVGLLSPQEGGMVTASLANQPASLVRAAIDGINGPLVSRWGHILLRRALVSRLAVPNEMEPVELATLRVKALNSIGEFTAARSLAQDIDTGNWDEALTDEALRAYIASSDFVGVCPALRQQLAKRGEDDPQWYMMRSICQAFSGETARANANLDNAISDEIAPEIDIVLALRYAGAAGRGRRAAEIEWEPVEALTPWRFALANAVGADIPSGLMEEAMEGPQALYYAQAAAASPMLTLTQRADLTRAAARRGVLSSKAMVDLYSAIYAAPTAQGESVERADLLRQAYIAGSPGARLGAMRALWGEGDSYDYVGGVVTAYAAARIAPDGEFIDQADRLIASMLSAGLDRDAAQWSNVVQAGSAAWAQLAVARDDAGRASADSIEAFYDNDYSGEARRSKFLIAGLAGLRRIREKDLSAFSEDFGMDLGRKTAWTRTISQAADVNNPALVALLAGLGMQGEDWSRMTPLHLYHVVRSLDRVGLNAEARMIAAEAVARG